MFQYGNDDLLGAVELVSCHLKVEEELATRLEIWCCVLAVDKVVLLNE